MTQGGKRNIGIIGGGFLGLTLAYRFARDGHRVTLYEKDATVGGLLRSIVVNGISMDRFYHVILTSDRLWIGLINELGLGGRLYFKETKAGFYDQGTAYPLATMGDFVRFPLLSPSEKVRLALTILSCKMQKDWHQLEHVSIQDFLVAKGGSSLFEKFWKPLLKAKFDGSYETIPMTYIWSRVRRMASTRRSISQREMMGHIRGNLQIVIDTIEQKIHELGSITCTGVAASNIVVNDGVAQGIVIGGQSYSHEVVISTLPHPQYQQLLPEYLRDGGRRCVQYMGVVSILLVTKEQLTPFHTLNLVDGTTPYTGIIETTNVIDPALMNGMHLVYVPKYVSPMNKQWLGRSDEDLRNECLGHLETMFPSFHRSDVEAVWIGREAFVEPLYTLDFHQTIPPIEGPAKGLFVANNSQTYPFLLNCESAVALANSVVSRVYSALGRE